VRSVDVAVDPATAFEVFTGEIGTWYRGGPYSWNDPSRAVGIRFEPGVGGRWIEVWDPSTGEGFELGQITVWEPGRRLIVSYRAFELPPEPRTEIEVRFEPIPIGTRVTLEHRGLDLLPPAMARAWQDRAWIQFIGWFRDHAGRGQS
jgi:Activator of Hsp90 ATPase homolog 1-like protein